MDKIRVQKEALIGRMKKNLKEHRQIFLEAQKAYRKEVISVLDAALKAAREGRPFVVSSLTRLVQPTCHAEDYERVIGMLKMDISDTVELTEAQYRSYVDDNWGWMHQFANEVTAYGIVNQKFSRYTTPEQQASL